MRPRPAVLPEPTDEHVAGSRGGSVAQLVYRVLRRTTACVMFVSPHRVGAAAVFWSLFVVVHSGQRAVSSPPAFIVSPCFQIGKLNGFELGAPSHCPNPVSILFGTQ